MLKDMLLGAEAYYHVMIIAQMTCLTSDGLQSLTMVGLETSIQTKKTVHLAFTALTLNKQL